MPKFVHEQTSFNAGIISPKLIGQTTLNQYSDGLKDSLNLISTKYGPITKRTGTQFVFPVKDQNKYQRLIPFSFSIDQNLVLEFGEQYIRFMTFDEFGVGLVTGSGSVPYEISTPYLEEHLKEIDYTQSADVLYLTHPKYPPKELKRYANNNWVLSDLVFLDGPYEDMNSDTTLKLTPAATSGTNIVLTSSSSLFSANDVGRYIRLHNQIDNKVAWGYGIIVSYTSDTEVNIDIIQPFATTQATSYWRLGAWNNYKGYPKACTIHQQRLTFAGGSEQQTIWGSNTSQYDNFAPSDIDGTITSEHAYTYNLGTEQFNSINWLMSFKSLLVGTTGSEFRVYSSGAVLTPGDRVAVRESAHGTANIKPIIIDNFLVFVQRLERKFRLFEYDYTTDSFTGPDLTLLAENLTLGGISCMAFQKEPQNVLWVGKTDGTLLSLVIDREQKVYAWNKHKINKGNVIDIVVIPSNYYKQDIVFLIIERVINGSTVKYIEIITPDFTDDKEHKEACFLDCALRYQGEATKTITGLSHLEGENVLVINEGASEALVNVIDGQITLPYEVTDCWVGLGYDTWLDTLSPSLNLEGRSYRNSSKRITSVVLSLYRTLGVSLFESSKPTERITIPDRVDDATPDSVPELRTEDVIQNPLSRSSSNNSLRIESEHGQPFTLRGLSVEIESND